MLSCSLIVYREIQEERRDTNYNVTPVSAAIIGRKSPLHSDVDAATDNEYSDPETTGREQTVMLEGNKIIRGGGYEELDPREVEEARIRAKHPSEYVALPQRAGLF